MLLMVVLQESSSDGEGVGPVTRETGPENRESNNPRIAFKCRKTTRFSESNHNHNHTTASLTNRLSSHSSSSSQNTVRSLSDIEQALADSIAAAAATKTQTPISPTGRILISSTSNHARTSHESDAESMDALVDSQRASLSKLCVKVPVREREEEATPSYSAASILLPSEADDDDDDDDDENIPLSSIYVPPQFSSRLVIEKEVHHVPARTVTAELLADSIPVLSASAEPTTALAPEDEIKYLKQTLEDTKLATRSVIKGLMNEQVALQQELRLSTDELTDSNERRMELEEELSLAFSQLDSVTALVSQIASKLGAKIEPISQNEHSPITATLNKLESTLRATILPALTASLTETARSQKENVRMAELVIKALETSRKDEEVIDIRQDSFSTSAIVPSADSTVAEVPCVPSVAPPAGTVLHQIRKGSVDIGAMIFGGTTSVTSTTTATDSVVNGLAGILSPRVAVVNSSVPQEDYVPPSLLANVLSGGGSTKEGVELRPTVMQRLATVVVGLRSVNGVEIGKEKGAEGNIIPHGMGGRVNTLMSQGGVKSCQMLDDVMVESREILEMYDVAGEEPVPSSNHDEGEEEEEESCFTDDADAGDTSTRSSSPVGGVCYDSMDEQDSLGGRRGRVLSTRGESIVSNIVTSSVIGGDRGLSTAADSRADIELYTPLEPPVVGENVSAFFESSKDGEVVVGAVAEFGDVKGVRSLERRDAGSVDVQRIRTVEESVPVPVKDMRSIGRSLSYGGSRVERGSVDRQDVGRGGDIVVERSETALERFRNRGGSSDVGVGTKEVAVVKEKVVSTSGTTNNWWKSLSIKKEGRASSKTRTSGGESSSGNLLRRSLSNWGSGGGKKEALQELPPLPDLPAQFKQVARAVEVPQAGYVRSDSGVGSRNMHGLASPVASTVSGGHSVWAGSNSGVGEDVVGLGGMMRKVSKSERKKGAWKIK
ncbi:hypothetical protein BCR33DRAFT_853053 [Rhizoclosmatium globosum]|uniref:Uncharacterized protein n=1 Tax=Rhizoclosmatium globosum TaxID=329046 RepID=A0A1Y2BYW2_9FUNG|nr:hypothetical protein BCR33DRAFT_853053 [Rhizoclosmatium globosum]|eukprot:ORY39926.1 hypothetical protein BCR33DRAFT_853053 [Rhizoclosmatium globosum]